MSIAEAALARVQKISNTAMQAKHDSRLDQFSISNALRRLSAGESNGFFEAEVTTDLARLHPTSTTNSIIVPWQKFVRAPETVGVAGQGGYLVETDTGYAQQAIAALTVVGSLATIIDGLKGNFSLPVIKTPAAANWQPTETTQAAASNQAIGATAMTPKTVGAYTDISRLLILQTDGADSADKIITADLAAAVGRAMDHAYLEGTGLNGQPTGLLSTLGVSTFSGTTATIGTLSAVPVAIGDALTPTSRPAWVGNRGTANTLRNRQEFSGDSKTLWNGNIVTGTVADFPAVSTTGVSAGNLFFGAWEYAAVAIWGGGLEIAVNPYSSFQAGIVGVRVMATTDFGLIFPSAFAVNSTPIT